MVLESIFSPDNSEKHPMLLLIFGFVISIIASLLSYWVFRAYSSMVFVFFTTIVCVPLIYRTIKLEETKDLRDLSESILIKEHWKALRFFFMIFVGAALGVTLLYIILPGSTVNTLFEAQISTLNNINSQAEAGITGNVTGMVSNSFRNFETILFNNLNVTIFCILFSFLYGVGAIFILIWNAAVIGVAMGNFIRSNLGTYAHLLGFDKIANYLSVLTIGLFKYSIHGIPEILAYFTAGLAGGIISIAVIKHDFNSRKFEHILIDSADLILISIGLIIIAAFFEVYATPFIFPVG